MKEIKEESEHLELSSLEGTKSKRNTKSHSLNRSLEGSIESNKSPNEIEQLEQQFLEIIDEKEPKSPIPIEKKKSTPRGIPQLSSVEELMISGDYKKTITKDFDTDDEEN